MRQMLRNTGRLTASLLIFSLCIGSAWAQEVTLDIDQVKDNDTLKVTLNVKETGLVPTPDIYTGNGVLYSGTIDLLYDATALQYKYTEHPIITNLPVYPAYPQTINVSSTTYGNAGAGSLIITPSRVPNPDAAGIFPDICNPPSGACVGSGIPYVRTGMADNSLSTPWQFEDNVSQRVVTHHFLILPQTTQVNGEEVLKKTSVLPPPVEVDSTTLVLCFLDAFVGPTVQCCKGDPAEAGSEVAGFCTLTGSFLPVELEAFTATTNNGDVVLSWTTASEVNNSGFSIEHAEAGSDLFEEVAFVPGAGNSTALRSYTYTVKDLDVGVHRFRLKQLDFDGAFQYSQVVEATIELAGTHRLSAAYPNPFNPSTTFELIVSRDQRVRIDIINALGQRVDRLFDGEVKANQPTNFVFRAGTLPTGLYFYRAIGENFAQTRQVLLVK